MNLYPKLSTGGYVITDDYGVLQSCSSAVRDFQEEENGVRDEIITIDHSGVYWKKE